MRQHVRHSNYVALGIAVGAVAAATVARYLLTPVFGPSALPYLLYFPAVAAVGLTGNLAAALFATLLSALAANVLFVAPHLGLDIGFSGSVALVAFLITCSAIAAITARLEKAVGKTEERARLACDRTAALERERSNLQRESRRLTLLADVGNIGVANPTFNEVAQHAARRVSEEIGDTCVIRVREGDQLTAIAWHHVQPEARQLLETALLRPEDAAKNPHYRRLFETRRSIVLADPPIPTLQGSLPPHLQPVYETYRPRHAVGTPIILGNEVIGTMSVLRAQPSPYSDAEVAAIEAVASRVALGMENARLLDNARREAEEARRVRATAEEASRVKDEFLGTLSHELRTPLNAIVGWAHMLRDHDLSEDRWRNAVETILRNAQSQEQLISDILDVQRIMAGKLRLDFRTVDLSAIVRAAADTVQPSAEAKRIKLQLLLDLNVTPIADARELLGTILGRYGADVGIAASAEEGMQSLQSRLPHVVLTDIEMPQEDGYAFIRRIRALPHGAGGRLPAAALTAYAAASDRMKVLAAGFNMHVAKPVQPAELAMVVASLAGTTVAQPEATKKQ